jgi:phosphatidylserine decarboxylase
MPVMRIPLTKYGLPQVIIFPAVLTTAVIIIASLGVQGAVNPVAASVIGLILTVILIWSVSFFRDPIRKIPAEKGIMLSPADGKITDIQKISETDFIKADTLKIGIFLSIFNVHINRSPCNAKVEKIIYRKGKKKNAVNPDSSRVNESNTLYLCRTDPPNSRLIVRQISGAIARRIVCKAKHSDKLGKGEKFGMIKFGSRTELYVPVNDGWECNVKIGDKVKAGKTILCRNKKS